MRPSSLYPLFTPLTTLDGVGPRLAPLFEKLAGPNPVDLLWRLPAGMTDRRYNPKVADAEIGKTASIFVKIVNHQPPDRPKRPHRVLCEDDSGFLTLIFFHARRSWLESVLPIGEERLVSGMVESFGDERQMTHPDYIVPADQAKDVMIVEPLYPLTAGIVQKVAGKAIRSALEKAPELEEWLDPPLMKREGWPHWRAALQAAHHPGDIADLSPNHPARRRLAYDELLANQLALAFMRDAQKNRNGREHAPNGRMASLIEKALPFQMTGAQKRSVAEINADLAKPARMLRLLQGDVGSGKTIVALMAMASVAESGSQSALMAPTEILAGQHFAALERFAKPAGLRIALLTGRDKGALRRELLARLEAGEIDILIGTHAIFQDDVIYRDLGLAVIDEQHRFGVHQRLSLADKGRLADMLVMTATPIPRTLVLTAYGDMDVSRLDEKPPGRQKIETRILPISRMDDVVEAVVRAVSGGARAYWVCPLVEESETLDLAAVVERHRDLEARTRLRIGLIHGKMKGSEKDQVMADFSKGDLDVLVASTVIEVGVDVPEATIMVIEHAERFGLAQLHQLRGRVGRGSGQSACLLLYGNQISEIGRARLKIIRSSEDGFLIAEEDLRLRGPGEILGARQSGLPVFRIADLAVHGDLLAIARNDARFILETSPTLDNPRGTALRTLLYLFRQDGLIKTLRSG